MTTRQEAHDAAKALLLRDHADFVAGNSEGIRLDLAGEDLSGANLQGANLSLATLAWADLGGADLRGADFTVADLTGADFHDAILQWAKFEGTEVPTDRLR